MPGPDRVSPAGDVQAGAGTYIFTRAFRRTISSNRHQQFELPRHSFRQDKWLDFDGVVGYIDLAREIVGLMPWARAAEALHFGQKAAFGLGKVRVLVLE